MYIAPIKTRMWCKDAFACTGVFASPKWNPTLYQIDAVLMQASPAYSCYWASWEILRSY